MPGAAYYYEPLFSLRPNGTSIETVIIKDPTQSNLIRQRIMGIFNCSWSLLQTLNKSSFKTVRKRGMSCRRSNPRVIKTIRLRRAGLESWILQDTSVKIVHLVRDPRAMISSISKRPGTWSDTLKNASYQCNRMLDDSKLEDILPHHRFNILFSFASTVQSHSCYSCRYIRVRYEDLVDHTNNTLARVYKHVGLPFTKHVQNAAFSRTHAENITGTQGRGYYNTFRSSNFAHDSWKKKLGLNHVKIIEKGCQEFMDINGYTAYDPS